MSCGFAAAASHGSVNRSLANDADCVAPPYEYAVPTTNDEFAPSTLAAMFCPVFVKTKSSMKFSTFVAVVLTVTLYGYGDSGVDVGVAVCVAVVDCVEVCVVVAVCVGDCTVPVGVTEIDAPTDSVADGDGETLGVVDDDGVCDDVNVDDGVCDDVTVDVGVVVGEKGTSTTGIDWIMSPVSVYWPTKLPKPLRYVMTAPLAFRPSTVPIVVLPGTYG